MISPPIFPYGAVRNAVPTGGEPIVAAYGPMQGGFIVNPRLAHDQGIAAAEDLYISIAGDAGLAADGITFALAPGQLYIIPKDLASNVSINAASSGHRFSAVILQPTSNYQPPTGDFPPDGPTTVLKTIISYLYQEYNDDDDLQAFVDSFNGMAQSITDWFVNIGLPVYTADTIIGALLDWVAQGLYGMARPALPSGRNKNIGPLNTWPPNSITLNTLKVIGNQNYYLTSDDVFKRILTWHFYKGDGKVFNIRWLKRRVMRFLIGVNGSAPNIDQTYQVSVTFGLNRQVNINILNGQRSVVGGALPNRFMLNTMMPNQLITRFTPFPQLPMAPIFKAAVEAGVLELPFQYTFVVNII